MGRPPTHVDSHHHVHRRAEIAPIARELAAALGVPLREEGPVRYVGGFYGQWEWQVTDLEHIRPEFLIWILRNEVDEGWTEIGCHPGFVTDDFTSVYLAEREVEVETLTDPRVRPRSRLWGSGWPAMPICRRRRTPMADGLSLIVTGGLGNMPFAGVAWQVLHYLEGFRRLGHRVFYLEDTGAWPFDPERGIVSEDAGPALAYVRRMLERVELDDAWAYRDAVDGRLHGASEERLRAELERADALVNVSAVTVLGEEHMQVPVRIYLETDPVLAQIEIAQGNQRTIGLLAAHTHHFTYGENFGAPDCTVPLGRFTYHPTRQPVILDWWRPRAGDGPPAPRSPPSRAGSRPPRTSSGRASCSPGARTSSSSMSSTCRGG